MQTEILKVTGMAEGGADKASSALRLVNGVTSVAISLAEHTATVQFDEQLSSIQELQASLVNAGFSVDPHADKKAGGCCGGCGGGGGGHCRS